MRRHTAGILTVIAVAAVIIGAIWLGNPHHKRGATGASEALMIKTSRVARRNFTARLRWLGRVENKNEAKLVALAAGRVMEIKAADGARVLKGDELLSLGGPQATRELKALKSRAAALSRQASIARDIAQTRQDAVGAKMARREELLAAREHVAGLEGDLVAAREELAAFRDALVVRAPMDGIFTNRRVSEGQDVERGARLADVISMERRVVGRFFPPPGVSLEGAVVSVETGGGGQIAGHIVTVPPERTPEGATVAWIESEAINRELQAGQSVSGRVALDSGKEALAVPQGAIVRDENENSFVFVKTSRGYRKKAVTTGLSEGGWVEVVSGLSDADEVVVRGAYELFYRDFNKTYKVAD